MGPHFPASQGDHRCREADATSRGLSAHSTTPSRTRIGDNHEVVLHLRVHGGVRLDNDVSKDAQGLGQPAGRNVVDDLLDLLRDVIPRMSTDTKHVVAAHNFQTNKLGN